MNPQKYLEDKLKNCAHYELTDSDKNLIEKEGIESYIYAKLTSKKFRKYKMTESSVEHTKQSIALRVAKNEPLTIFYPQGGYKLWTLPSTPEVDWAEFMNIAYVLSYIAPIAAAYQPGVTLTYFLHTFLMQVHGNLTEEEVEAYGNSFEKLLEAFRRHLPKHIQLTTLKDRDLYTWGEYREELEEIKKTVTQEAEQWPEDKKERLGNMARLNMKWKGAEDFQQLSEAQKEEKIYEAMLYEESAPRLKKVGESVKSVGNILLFNKAGGNFIGIGTSKTSIAKYWVGMGVLKPREDSYQEYILSPKQIEAEKYLEETIEIEGLLGKNFHTIQITKTSELSQ